MSDLVPAEEDFGGDPDWSLALAEVARDIQTGHTQMDDTAAAVASAAINLLPNVDISCVTVVDRDHTVRTLGATGPIPAVLNAVQQQHRAGPCLTALWCEPLVSARSLAQETRWPEYTQAATDAGILSVLSVRLYVQKPSLGALSLYSTRDQAFGEDEVLAAQTYAAHAAVALDQAREREHLHTAIDSRDLIGQARAS